MPSYYLHRRLSHRRRYGNEQGDPRSCLGGVGPGQDAARQSSRRVRPRRAQFARYYMIRLGIGHDLTRIALNPKYPRKLANEAELLALRPELNHIE